VYVTDEAGILNPEFEELFVGAALRGRPFGVSDNGWPQRATPTVVP